jgi:hypothetical protein
MVSSFSQQVSCSIKCPTPRAPDKCGDSAIYRESAQNRFFRLLGRSVISPPLPVTPAVGRLNAYQIQDGIDEKRVFALLLFFYFDFAVGLQ